MEKRTLLVVAISMGILFVWWKIFPPAQPPDQLKAAVTALPVVAKVEGAKAPQAADPSPPSGPSIAPEVVVLETNRARYELSNVGADLRKAVLKDDKFLKTKGDRASGLDVVAAKAEGAPLRVSFPRGDLKLSDGLTWAVKSRSATEVVFRTENDRWITAQITVASPFLSPLDRLEQEGVFALQQL